MTDPGDTQDGTREVSAAEVEAATEALRGEGLIEAELEDEYLRDAAVAALTAAASVRQGEHRDTTCSECGSAFCATVMHDLPDSVGADSMDVGFREICPYCWLRGMAPPTALAPTEGESDG